MLDEKYVIVYYKNDEIPEAVYQSQPIERVSSPKDVCIKNLAPKLRKSPG